MPNKSCDKVLDLAKKAALRYGNHGDGVFNATNYATVVQEEFGVLLDARTVEKHLDGVPFIRHLKGVHWQVHKNIMQAEDSEVEV